MSDRITYMHSGQIGAPQMSGAAGSNGQMLQVLDACLIDGFNPQTATTATKTATTVTLTFGVSHGYALRQLVTVTGANDALLNGKHRVVSLTTNTITINAVGVTVTTGVIVTKVAPLGFDSIFGSADPLKRAYRSPNLQGTRTVLYLDMSLPTSHGYNSANPAKRAMVDLCENMTTLGTQINSYTSTFNKKPTNRNGQMFWYQSRAPSKSTAVTNNVASEWVVVGNSNYFYFFPVWQTYDIATPLQRDIYGFGDMPSFSAVDNFNCMWIGAITINDTATLNTAMTGAKIGGDPSTLAYGYDHGQIGFFIKPSDGVGGLQNIVTTFNGDALHKAHSGYNDSTLAVNFPNPSSQSLISMPLYLMSKNSIRSTAGCLRGIPQHMNNDPSIDLSVVDTQLLIVVAMNGYYGNIYGYYAIDIRD